MSHFPTVVLGDEPEAKLAPYDENIEVPSYVDERIPLEKARETFAPYFADTDPDGKLTESEKVRAYYGERASIEFVVDDEDGAQEVVTRTTYNPKSKWDWYVLGGRWEGFFLLKDGSHSDETTIGEIDWEGMRADIAERAGQQHDQVTAILKRAGLGQDAFPTRTWEDFIKLYVSDDEHTAPVREGGPQAAREAWAEYEGVRALRTPEAYEVTGYMSEPIGDFFLLEDDARDKYVASKVEQVGVPHAFISPDGEWHQQGRMGWFGLSTDDVSAESWATTFHNTLQSLPADTPVRQYDLHI